MLYSRSVSGFRGGKTDPKYTCIHIVTFSTFNIFPIMVLVVQVLNYHPSGWSVKSAAVYKDASKFLITSWQLVNFAIKNTSTNTVSGRIRHSRNSRPPAFNVNSFLPTKISLCPKKPLVQESHFVEILN